MLHWSQLNPYDKRFDYWTFKIPERNLSLINIQNSLIAFKAIAAIALSVAFGNCTYLP